MDNVVINITELPNNVSFQIIEGGGGMQCADLAACQTIIDIEADLNTVASDLAAHESNTSNPHNVTKSQVGLGNVDNTSDLNKPVSTAQQTALNLKEDVANKSTSVNTDQASNVKYPSVKSVYDWITANYQPKKFSYTNTALGTATSGTGNQFSKSVLIPANTLTSGALNIKGRATKSGSSSYGWLNVYVNSANNLTGAKHIGQIKSVGWNTLAYFAIDRTIPIQSGSFVTFIVNTTNGFEEIVTNQVSTATIDWTVDQYVILSCQCNVGIDTMRANFLSVNQF